MPHKPTPPLYKKYLLPVSKLQNYQHPEQIAEPALYNSGVNKPHAAIHHPARKDNIWILDGDENVLGNVSYVTSATPDKTVWLVINDKDPDQFFTNAIETFLAVVLKVDPIEAQK